MDALGKGADEAATYMQEEYAFEGVDRSGEPAVLVRASAPDSRDVFHGDERCGQITGAGRRLADASWMLLEDARAAGYRPCLSCGVPSP
ncbi:hypothetical protein [Streptomyces leeuwenhoekii]|uniref:hypothetical protein n=1 Tax=Streptomyces leeuwenhoekii TaxID=1437453 RepID=UPI000A8A4D3D|nr:hypothetical protein [Streptomyces leeuwenhoekii]